MLSLKTFATLATLSLLNCTPAAAQSDGPGPLDPWFVQRVDPSPTEIQPDGPNMWPPLDLNFGIGLAIDGNTLLASEAGALPPRVAVFTRKCSTVSTCSTARWARTGTLYAPGFEWEDWDFHSMKAALDGDVALVASKRTVYVFHRDATGWHQVQRVRAPTPDGVTEYPRTLAFDAGTAVVTASTPTGGLAYVYQRQTDGRLAWQARLRSLTGISGDGFGASAAIHNNTIAIGAPGVKSVFVFKRSGTTWKRTQQVMPVELSDAQSFGLAVAVNGNTLVVGAPEGLCEGTTGERQCGAAYVFGCSHGTYTLRTVLHPGPEENPDYDAYGRIVVLTSDRLVVSAHWELIDTMSGSLGLSFVYKRSGSSVQILGIARDDYLVPWNMVSDGAQVIVSGGDNRRYWVGNAEVFNIRNGK